MCLYCAHGYEYVCVAVGGARVCSVCEHGACDVWAQAAYQGVCVCPGVMCVPAGMCVRVGAAEGEGSWAASLSSLDRALEKI